jgi:hypothetical protein
MSVESEMEKFLSDAMDKRTEFQTVTGNRFYINGVNQKYINISIPENEKSNALALRRSGLLELLNSEKRITSGTGNVLLVVIAPTIDTDIFHVVGGAPFHIKFGGNITHILYGNIGVRPPTLSGTGQHVDSTTPLNFESTTIFGAWVKRHSCVTGTILAPEFVIIARAATKLLGRAIRAVKGSLPPGNG